MGGAWARIWGSVLGAGAAMAVGAGPAAASAGWTAYVGNSGASIVTPIATATNTAGTPIDNISSPISVAITPDGQTAYVTSNSTSTPSVVPIATANNAPGTPIPFTSLSPVAIAINPTGTTAYVVDAQEDAPGHVTPINLATGAAGPPITVGDDPEAIAILPYGNIAYVVNNNLTGTVTPIDLSTNTPGPAIDVGTSPTAIAVAPNGETAYVTNGGDGTVTPINTATNAPGRLISVGSSPVAIAITPDGRTAYVTDDLTSGEVVPIDLATGTGVAAIPVGSDPDGVAITPDGKTAYVSNQGGSVTPISTATNTPGTPIPVTGAPAGIAITPDQAPLAAFSFHAAPPGSASSFDGSASASAVGSIASYEWNFGDGQTATTTTPVTSHVYAKRGKYTVILMVTDTAGTSMTQVFTGQTVSLNGGPQARITHTITIAAIRPAVTQVSQSHSVWREGNKLPTIARKSRHPVGTTFSFTLSEQAGVSFTFTQKVGGRKVHGRCVAPTKQNRHKRACRRTVTRGTLLFNVPGSQYKVFFDGRLSRSKKLAPGHYTLVIVAKVGGKSSSAKTLRFTIVKK
jgi:YVTN family beta-propeller protein